MAEDLLREYRSKRDFTKTSEPAGGQAAARKPTAGRRYLIQKHAARRLHFDFRLEHDGVLKSWAVTRGPSLDPADKRLAVRTEDHPLDYGDFEGTIPAGEYGGGTVMLWDEGSWEPQDPDEDVDEAIRQGKLKIVLHGERLKGAWMLVRIKNNRDRKSRAENWLLFKERDAFAATETHPLAERAATSVRSGRTMAEIAAGNVEWTRSGLHVREADPPPEIAAPGGGAKGGDRGSSPPAFVAPQLATLTEDAPVGDDWLHEIKYDGYRAIAAVGGGEARIYTRKGLDWTARFRPLVRPLADLPCESALLDGEICVIGPDGKPSFAALQDALGPGAAEGRHQAFVYYLFDLLWQDGTDLRRLPLIERKERLAALLGDVPAAGPLFYSDHVRGNGPEAFRHACGLGLEGIVSKRADSVYRSQRTRSWLKVKCQQGQEFVIVGWEPSPVKGRPFAALLTAVREGGRLVYRGKVGTGFSAETLERVFRQLAPREIDEPAVDEIPAPVARKARFVRPELVAEIDFRGWSSDGLIRQGSFKGLREDKSAGEVIKEVPTELADPERAAPAVAPGSGRAQAKGKGNGKRGQSDGRVPRKKPSTTVADPTVEPSDPKPGPRRHSIHVAQIDDDKDGNAIQIEGVRVTNPDRIMFPGRNITKRMLIDYYLGIADRILPHVADRPLSLVRCPRGQAGDCFFQKHASVGFPTEFRPIEIREKNGSDIYLYIEDRKGLVAAVQMGALELHIWGSHVKTLEQPDRLVFDFDPDEEIGFGMVKSAAAEMRERLKAIGLTSFCMTTGGKGLHVVVPLTPKDQWDDIRVFAEALARAMAADDPDRYLAVMSKARRKGRIFIDYLRNGRGATAICPYSTRAKPGAPVAWPIAWSALGKLENAHPASVETAAALLKKQRTDPWRGYFAVDQVLPLAALRG